MLGLSITDSTHSGNVSPHLPNIQQSGSAAGNTGSANGDVQTGLSSSMRERVSSLATSIRNALPDEHLANNDVIERRNEQLSNFLKSVKQPLKEVPSLAEADITNSVLSHEFSYDELPEDLVAPIKAKFKRLPPEKQTFGALRDIVLENRQEEKSFFSVCGTRLVHLLVDLGSVNFTLTPKELTDKNKTFTIEQIESTYNTESKFGSTLLAVGHCMYTVYNNLANRAVTWKYNPIDWLANKAHKIGHDGSSYTLTKVLLAVPAAIIAFGSKLALKIGRFGVGLAAALLTPFALLVGAICYAIFKYVLVPSAQAVGRQIGWYDNDLKKYCEYKFSQAEDSQNMRDMLIYATGVSPFSKLNVTAEGVKAMKNDEAYQAFKKAEK